MFADFATSDPLKRGRGWRWEVRIRFAAVFSVNVDLEARVETEHPLRPIREIANTALAALSGEFEALYSGLGRPSIQPEKLLRAMLLQAFYSVRARSGN